MRKNPESGNGRMVEEVDGELAEIDKEAVRRSRWREEWSCKELGDLVDLAKRRGYNDPEKWAAKIWSLRQSTNTKIADDLFAAYEIGDLVPDPVVLREFDISAMTLWRWTRDPELNFPPAIRIRKRNFRSRQQLDEFKLRLIRSAISRAA